MKLVREHINEKFTEDSDPIQDLGIGMRHLIEKWVHEFKFGPGKNRAYVPEAELIINEDLTIDVKGSLNLYSLDLIKLPDFIQFNKVTETCWINHNVLTTLKGCPKWVGRNFYCGNNKLTSLEYAPKHVRGKFSCENNTKQFTAKEVKAVCDAYSVEV
jgi:hypothetical protein